MNDLYVLGMGGDTHLIYSPLRNLIASVNGEAVSSLRRGRSSASDDPLADMWSRLDAPAHLPAMPGEPGASPAKLVIIPTRRCNLRCLYCDFVTHPSGQDPLDPRLACRLIDHAFRHTDPSAGPLHVHFFGGEPFLYPSVLDLIVHYARQVSARCKKPLRLEATTNGNLDPDYAAFIGRVFDTVVVSYDGSPFHQNSNRPHPDGSGSFDAVATTLGVLSSTPAELCVRMCATDRSVDDLPALARDILDTYDADIINIEPLAPNPSSRRNGLQAPDPYAFFRSFMDVRDVARSYGAQVVGGLTNVEQLGWSSCPVGRDALMLLPDGRLSACYLDPDLWHEHGMDNIVGRVHTDGRVDLDRQNMVRIRDMVQHKPRCNKCFCRWSCAGGCHIALTPPGCELTYTDTCIQTRLISATLLLEKVSQGNDLTGWMLNTAWQRALAEQDDDRLFPGGSDEV